MKLLIVLKLGLKRRVKVFDILILAKHDHTVYIFSYEICPTCINALINSTVKSSHSYCTTGRCLRSCTAAERTVYRYF